MIFYDSKPAADERNFILLGWIKKKSKERKGWRKERKCRRKEIEKIGNERKYWRTERKCWSMVIKCKSKERKCGSRGKKCRNTERKCRCKKRKYGSKEMGFLWCEGGSVCGLDEEKKFHICDTRRRYKQMLLRIVSRITERCCVDETMLI